MTVSSWVLPLVEWVSWSLGKVWVPESLLEATTTFRCNSWCSSWMCQETRKEKPQHMAATGCTNSISDECFQCSYHNTKRCPACSYLSHKLIWFWRLERQYKSVDDDKGFILHHSMEEDRRTRDGRERGREKEIKTVRLTVRINSPLL